MLIVGISRDLHLTASKLCSFVTSWRGNTWQNGEKQCIHLKLQMRACMRNFNAMRLTEAALFLAHILCSELLCLSLMCRRRHTVLYCHSVVSGWIIVVGTAARWSPMGSIRGRGSVCLLVCFGCACVLVCLPRGKWKGCIGMMGVGGWVWGGAKYIGSLPSHQTI